MSRLLLRRLLSAVPVLLGAATLSFLVLHLLPGDPVSILLGGRPASAEVQAELRRQLGVDRPLIAQYGSFLGNAVQGDLGRSTATGEPVTERIRGQLGPTVQLTVAAASLALPLGVVGGVLSSLVRRRWLDRLFAMVRLTGLSVPSFWLGLLLITFVSFRLGWLPATGNDGLSTVVMPAITLAVPAAAIIAQLVRDSLLRVRQEPFMTTARAKGLSRLQVAIRHGLRNAILPTLTVAGLVIGNLLSGAVIIEQIFARRGLGQLAINAVTSKDFPLVQGVVLFAAVVYVCINVVVEMLYVVIDPRIRDGQGR